MSTVSIGSNKTYADNWESIFSKGRSTKKKAPPAKSKKAAPAQKKGKSAKASGKSAKSGKRKG